MIGRFLRGPMHGRVLAVTPETHEYVCVEQDGLARLLDPDADFTQTIHVYEPASTAALRRGDDEIFFVHCPSKTTVKTYDKNGTPK